MDLQSFDLTIEQLFQYRQIELATEQMSREQLVDMLLSASRLVMVKDNVIRSTMAELAKVKL